jgi:hypothetical protein
MSGDVELTRVAASVIAASEEAWQNVFWGDMAGNPPIWNVATCSGSWPKTGP